MDLIEKLLQPSEKKQDFSDQAFQLSRVFQQLKELNTDFRKANMLFSSAFIIGSYAAMGISCLLFYNSNPILVVPAGVVAMGATLNRIPNMIIGYYNRRKNDDYCETNDTLNERKAKLTSLGNQWLKDLKETPEDQFLNSKNPRAALEALPELKAVFEKAVILENIGVVKETVRLKGPIRSRRRKSARETPTKTICK